MKTKKLPNLLLLAGGLGKRMHRYTADNHYPKLLLSLGQETMLDKIISTYGPHFKKIGIVLSDRTHIKMLRRWVEQYHPTSDIKFIHYDKTDGTRNTLREVLKTNEEFAKHTVLHWSDILTNAETLVKSIQKYDDAYSDGIIFVDKNPRHRLHFYEQRINTAEGMTGNIAGIYYFRNYDFVYTDYNDEPLSEVDFANHLGYFLNDVEDSIIKAVSVDIEDIGDPIKYETYLKNTNIDSRYFNKIEVLDDHIKKTALNEKGLEVLNFERQLYKTANNEGWPFPKLVAFTDDSILIERIKGQTVFQYLNEVDYNRSRFDDVARNIIKMYTCAISKIHDCDTIRLGCALGNNAIKEYHDIMVNRVNEVDFLIPFDTDFYVEVNGIIHGCDDYEQLRNQLLHILSVRETRWTPIHGDTNTSNMMIEGRNIKFIDPRGRFGDSKIFGDPMYDYAKMIYGLHAYDGFNLDKYFTVHINDETRTVKFEMHYGYDLDELLDALPNMSCVDKAFVGYLVGVIFVKLTSYIKNNPNKAIASFYYGCHLMTEYGKTFYRESTIEKMKIKLNTYANVNNN